MNHPLCSHGMNQKSCPTCYRLPPITAKSSADMTPSEKAKQEHAKLLARAQEQLAASQAEITKQAHERAKTNPVPQGSPNVASPYSHANESAGTYDETGLWVPPARVDLIDRAPRHPHADAAPFKVLNPMPLPPSKV